MKLLSLSALLIFGFTVSAHAGDSGCGLGSLIIQKNTKLLQLFSMTTNGIFFTQPLGITSGTSGCSASGLVSNDRQTEYFVEINQDDLSREMAQGHGEKLNTLAVLQGCKTTEAQKTFGEWTQKSYSKIVPAAGTTPSELVKNLKTEMQSSDKVIELCESAKVSSL